MRTIVKQMFGIRLYDLEKYGEKWAGFYIQMLGFSLEISAGCWVSDAPGIRLEFEFNLPMRRRKPSIYE